MQTILIVDDDRDFTSIAVAYLAKAGYAAEVAGDGKEGLSRARALKPVLVLLDIMMPGMNGIEVLRELQSYEETAGIPVLLVSGRYFDGGMYSVFAQEPNFKGFVAKPVSLEDLRKKVEALIGK